MGTALRGEEGNGMRSWIKKLFARIARANAQAWAGTGPPCCGARPRAGAAGHGPGSQREGK